MKDKLVENLNKLVKSMKNPKYRVMVVMLLFGTGAVIALATAHGLDLASSTNTPKNLQGEAVKPTLQSSTSPQLQSSIQPKSPNIVFILTDDVSSNLMRFVPKTNQLVRDQGIRFTNYMDNIALCCAARAAILLGQYAHNSKMEDNVYPNGGFETYREKGHTNNDLGVWLQNAGYSTSLMGKYLNQYPGASYNTSPYVPKTWQPPGFSDWFVPVEGGAYGQYNYTMNENGKTVSYGNAPEDYMTDVIRKRAVRYIQNRKDSSKPYFMFLSTYSAHSPFRAAPRHIGTHKDADYPKTDNYNETNTSDKPPFMAEIPLMDAQTQKESLQIYRKRADSMMAVDDLVADVIGALRDTGKLENTYVVFSSDNGYHLGEHRMPVGKYSPYETDINLPLYIMGPGIEKGGVIHKLSGNIDLAPTFADLAGIPIPSNVDGQSLKPFLTRTATQPARKYFLLERKIASFVGEPLAKADSTVLEVADSAKGEVRPYLQVPYYGVRTNDGYKYIEYSTGAKEFYNLNTDPYELHNLLPPSGKNNMTPDDQVMLAKLISKLQELKTCGNGTCQQIDR